MCCTNKTSAVTWKYFTFLDSSRSFILNAQNPPVESHIVEEIFTQHPAVIHGMLSNVKKCNETRRLKASRVIFSSVSHVSNSQNSLTWPKTTSCWRNYYQFYRSHSWREQLDVRLSDEVKVASFPEFFEELY